MATMVPHTALTAMAIEVGARLGHYNVTAKIGEGGMGAVYRAVLSCRCDSR